MKKLNALLTLTTLFTMLLSGCGAGGDENLKLASADAASLNTANGYQEIENPINWDTWGISQATYLTSNQTHRITLLFRVAGPQLTSECPLSMDLEFLNTGINAQVTVTQTGTLYRQDFDADLSQYDDLVASFTLYDCDGRFLDQQNKNIHFFGKLPGDPNGEDLNDSGNPIPRT